MEGTPNIGASLLPLPPGEGRGEGRTRAAILTSNPRAAFGSPLTLALSHGEREHRNAKRNLIARYRRINFLRPPVDSAREVPDFLETRVPQELNSLGAAAAGLAMHDDLVGRRELVDSLGKLAQRDLHGFRNGRDFDLVRLAHI